MGWDFWSSYSLAQIIHQHNHTQSQMHVWQKQNKARKAQHSPHSTHKCMQAALSVFLPREDSKHL